jgi:hypothetical protein
MNRTSLNTTRSRLAVAVAILFGLLLLLGTGTAAADGDEAPINVLAVANGPGLDGKQVITVYWAHSGDGVSYFIVEQESPPNSWPTPDPDKRGWIVQGLDHNTTYRYRVCAVFEFNPVCSEDWSNYETTRSPEAPPQQQDPPAPRIVSHQVEQNAIGIRWEAGHDYNSYFVNYTLKAAPGELQHGPQTIHHDDDGTWGYQLVGNLTPGRTYIFHVQGCTETALGILEDHCWGWSAPYEAELPLPAPPPPSKPVITVLEPTTQQINLRWDVVADERITRTVVYRDGGAYYDAPKPLPMLEDGNGKVKSNREYRYHVCLTNVTDTTCSDPVTAITRPVAPTAPANVEVFRPVGGAPYIVASWVNTEIPGRFITVERRDTSLRPSCPPNRPVATCPVGFWNELQRISADDDPTSVRITETEELLVVEAGTEYRVCAVVPALGEAGKVCSAPVTVTVNSPDLTQPPRPLPPHP